VLWPRITRWDAGKMDAALAEISAPLLAIQSTTRSADLKRAPMKPGDTSPWLDLLKSRGARVEIVPDTGHFTMLEAAATVNRLIAGFIKNP
jgi:pimeloyl-ACP methyl ester carboxylesterase